MKKRVLLIVLASFMFMGIVSAASLWGTYKGNQIIRLTVDGVPVKVSDAPAVSMDGRTMIPIYLLKDAGVKYSWDQKNQTVNIIKPEPVITTVQSDRFSNGVGISDINNWAFVAAYYAELESFASRLYIALGSFNFLASNIVYGASDSTVDGLFDGMKTTLENINDDFIVLVDSYETEINKKFEWMGIGHNDLNVVISNYDKALDYLYEAHGAIGDYEYKNAGQPTFDKYSKFHESATNHVATAQAKSREQFMFWNNGIVLQQP